MFATGKLAVESAANSKFEQECLLGFEYCGIDSSGKRVMGIAPNRCLANFVKADPYLTWEIPSNWSLEDAATIPVVYGTCYFALYKSGMISFEFLFITYKHEHFIIIKKLKKYLIFRQDEKR